jgi:hypothetical protein
VTGRRFFPLDQKLRLRRDHWSEGAARVAVEQGLQAKSFELASRAYSHAVGLHMSADSLRRVTEGWGQQVEDQRIIEAERANGLGPWGESPREQRVAEVDPIVGLANISTDGAMVLLRHEGWKEVKLTAISEVQVKGPEASAVSPALPSRRAQDPQVELSRHSYQAGVWDADTMAQHQYTEGLRRGIDHCQRLSSTNDGAPWIERITAMNFSHAPQIIDWSHASQHLWTVAHEVFGENTPPAQQWAERQLDRLWNGQVLEVVATLDSLNLNQDTWSPLVRQAPDYFRSRQKQMQYAHFRAEGYPIGSGTVESAANTVIHHRLKRPGRGWNRDNAQAMLAGLSELHSGRFERAWQATLPLAG